MDGKRVEGPFDQVYADMPPNPATDHLAEADEDNRTSGGDPFEEVSADNPPNPNTDYLAEAENLAQKE